MNIVEKRDYAIVEMPPELNEKDLETIKNEIAGPNNAESKNIVLNMEHIKYIYSMEISLIIRLIKDMKSLGGQLNIVNANTQVEKVMKAANLDKLVPLYKTLEELELEKDLVETNFEDEIGLTRTLELENELTIARLKGICVFSSSHEVLRDLFEELHQSKPYFLFDFSKLDLIDSSALEALRKFAVDTKSREGLIVAVNLTGLIKDLFETFGLDSLMNLFDNEDQAKKFLRDHISS